MIKFINYFIFMGNQNCRLFNENVFIPNFFFNRLKLKNLIETIPKSKKNRRCLIHSLDKTRSLKYKWNLFSWYLDFHEYFIIASGNPFGKSWLTNVEMKSLQLNSVLYSQQLKLIYENLSTINWIFYFVFYTIEFCFLSFLRFCSECRLKVLEAYDLLIDDCDCKRQETKGFCSVLYEGIEDSWWWWISNKPKHIVVLGFRSCLNEKHIHIDCRKDFICNLINRAEIEIQGGRRERHAKTIDVAQEEILTCIGIHLFEKFEKLHRSMKSEEQIWKMIFSIGIDCLRLSMHKKI